MKPLRTLLALAMSLTLTSLHAQNLQPIDPISVPTANDTVVSAVGTHLDASASVSQPESAPDTVAPAPVKIDSIAVAVPDYEALRARIADLEQRIASADSLRLTFALGRFDIPYTLKRVERGKAELAKITTPKLKPLAAQITKLLDEYAGLTADLRRLLQDLQLDKRRDNFAYRQEYLAHARSLLATHSAIKALHANRMVDYSYLTKVVNTLKARIDNPQAGSIKTHIDLTDIIDELQ